MKRYYYILIFVFLFIPILVNGLEFPKTDSKIVLIYDLTDGKEIYSYGSKDKIYIASLTKIATTITAIENIDDLSKKVTITQEMLNTVSNVASTAGLKAGDRVTYRDLLYASMLPSGADATNALAILSSGSINNFVKKMNELVQRIGLENTHFVNVTGLDTDNHYSTVDEVRQLLVYSLSNDTFKQIYTTRDYTLTNGLKVKSTIYLYNPGNRLDTSSIIGSKSGHTKKAGYCLSSLSNINGHEMIIIVLQANYNGKYYYNVYDSLNLIKFLMNNYNDEVLVNRDKLITKIPVKLSKIESYEIKSTKEIKKYLPSDYDKDKIKIEYKGLNELSYKNKKNSKIGTINYYYDDQLLDTEDVIVNKDIKMDLLKVLIHYWYIILIIIIVIITLIITIIKKKKNRQRKKRYVRINGERRLYEK